MSRSGQLALLHDNVDVTHSRPDASDGNNATTWNPSGGRHSEKEKWRHHFADDHDSSTELEALKVEKDQLLKAILKFDPSETRNTWTFNDFQDAVRKARSSWENKTRLWNGKPQNHFHKILGKFHSHSNLFKIFPDSDKYVSVLTGAAIILVKASASHVRTSEELSQVLEAVNDAAARCDVEADLIRSEAMRRAIAKFYIAVFLLMSDAITWYNSPSRRKILNSLQDNFSNKFRDSLARIDSLSLSARRVADEGTGAELRVVRLELEDLQDELGDLRAGLVGGIRKLAEISCRAHEENLEQHRHTQELLTLTNPLTINEVMERMKQLWHLPNQGQVTDQGGRLLLENGVQSYSDHEGFQTCNNGRTSLVQTQAPLAHQLHFGTFQGRETEIEGPKNADLSQLSARLLQYVCRGSDVTTFPTATSGVLHDEHIVAPVSLWMSKRGSTLLYLENLTKPPAVSPLTFAALRIVLCAEASKVPVISFFCEPQLPGLARVPRPDCDPLIGLAYSLIHQMLSILGPLAGEKPHNLDSSRFTNLDGSSSSWPNAIRLLRDTLPLAPPLLLCVIDGLDAFSDPHRPSPQLRELLSTIRLAMEVTNGKICKVLFTASKRIFGLLPGLASHEIRVIQSISGVRPGMRTGGATSRMIPLNIAQHLTSQNQP